MGQFTYGHKSLSPDELWKGSKERIVSFGPEELQMIIYINPDKFSNFRDGTPAHEMRHALYTLAGVAFGDAISQGSVQHYNMYQRSPLYANKTERIVLEHYLIALSIVQH